MNARRMGTRPIAAVALALIFIASGCVDAEINSEFRADGSARHTWEVAIEKSGLEQLSGFGVSPEQFDFERARAQAEAAGLEYDVIDTDELAGFRASKDVEDSRDVGAVFNDIFSATASGGASPFTDAVTGAFGEDGDTYTLTLTVNSDRLNPLGDAGAGQIPMDRLASFVDIAYIVTMPGMIRETNGEQFGNNQIRWTLPLTGTTTMTAVSEGEGGTGLSIPLIIGLIVVVALVALVAAYLLLRRRRPVRAAATAPVATAPNTMVAGEPSEPDNRQAPRTET